MAEAMQKLNTMGQVRNQVVEVQFPEGKKNYSYIGSGNLRTGQSVPNAPVTHYISGKNYVCKKPVKVVATHSVQGAQVGDKIGVFNGSVKKIPVGLKYLPGAKEQEQNRKIKIKDKKMTVYDYMKNFAGYGLKKQNLYGEEIGGNNAKNI